MADQHQTYTLPGSIAVALRTNRAELMTICINQVKAGYVIPQDQVVGILEALRDILKIRSEDTQRIKVLEVLARQLSACTKGLVEVETHIRMLAEKLGSGQSLNEAEREILNA